MHVPKLLQSTPKDLTTTLRNQYTLTINPNPTFRNDIFAVTTDLSNEFLILVRSQQLKIKFSLDQHKKQHELQQWRNVGPNTKASNCDLAFNIDNF